MSYILEALKKSEDKRQQENSVSPLHRNHMVLPTLRKEKAQWKVSIWLIIALLLVLTIVISWYSLRKNQIEMPLPQNSVEESQQPVKSQEEVVPPTEQQISEPPVPELRPVKEKIIISTEEPVEESNSQDILQPKPLGTPEIYPPVPLSQTINKTPFLKELSASFQQSVPDFKFAGHVYSVEPPLRMVMINHRIVREKDIIEAGIILEEITPDGVILQKNEERFRMNAY